MNHINKGVPLSFIIICPGCKQTLTLPHEVVGKQVSCPKCEYEFEAHPTATPALDALPQNLELDSDTDKTDAKPSAPPPLEPPLLTAYSPAANTVGRPTSDSNGSVYRCVECGTPYPRTDEMCPKCGYRNFDLLAERLDTRHRPRSRDLPPVNGFLAVIAAFLMPLGALLICFGPIISEGFRRPGSVPFVIGMAAFSLGWLVEFVALMFCLIWLYQAWRVILERDEEYSPGLMVGLLAVPFFNLYWMFRAVPGLSSALQKELNHVAPNRPTGAGWTAGLVACIMMLIPYFQPIAICIFIGWMLIANNAVHRLLRIHARLRAEEEAEANGEPSRMSERLERREVG